MPDDTRGRWTDDDAPVTLVKAEPPSAGVAIPESVTHRPGRVGDQHRLDVSSHLGNMHAQGFIDADEFRARDALAQAAVTRQELAGLTADLPPAPVSRLRLVTPAVASRWQRVWKMSYAPHVTAMAVSTVGVAGLDLWLTGPVLLSPARTALVTVIAIVGFFVFAVAFLMTLDD